MSLSPHDPFSQVPVQATGLILKGDFLIYDFFILIGRYEKDVHPFFEP